MLMQNQTAKFQPADTEAVVALEGLRKAYGPFEVLRGITMDIRKGEFLTVLGPSGSGKTTILKLLAGLEPASDGRIVMGDRDLATLPINRRPFNTVFQDYALFPHMSVEKNIAYGPMIRKQPKASIRAEVAQVIGLVSLSGLEKRYPNQLSGGQKQRVALARALVNKPEVILLDEPLSALDAVLRRQMQQFLKSIQKQTGVTFVFVTHDQEEAIYLSDRICLLDSGLIQQVGSAEDIYNRPSNLFVARFFGENNYVDGKAAGDNGDGTIAVSTPLGMITAHNHTNRAFAAGDDAILVFRPERVGFGDGNRSGQSRLVIEAELRDVEFFGASSLLHLVRTDAAEQPLSMRVTAGAGGVLPPVGTRLQLAIDFADISAVPPERI